MALEKVHVFSSRAPIRNNVTDFFVCNLTTVLSDGGFGMTCTYREFL